MIAAELVSLSQILPRFHSVAEQVTGTNPASFLQKAKRPQSQDAYILSYFKIFSSHDADPSDIKSLRGLLHVGMVCAGYPDDLEEISTTPHGLRMLAAPPSRNAGAILFAGDVEQWSGAIQSASRDQWRASVREWAAACYAQFAKHNLKELLDVDPPKKVNGYLTYE